MKILFVAPYLPSPPRFGGQRRIDGLMRGLAADHDVSILSFNATDAFADQSVATTRLYCKTVTTLPDFEQRYVGDKRRLQLRSLFSIHSFERLQVEQRADFQRKIDEHLETEAYDVLQVEFANMATFRYSRRGRKPLLVLDEHNIEYDLQRRTAGSADGVSRQVYNALNWRKFVREETQAWRSFDGVVVTSERDSKLLLDVAPGTATAVVPNGVDTEEFSPSQVTPAAEELLFFGANNYFPNHDALLYFIDEIMPAIVARRPNAKLTIVGPGVQTAVLARQSRNVEVVGFVDDLSPYLDRASAVVVPLRIGGGTRLKIVEAMAKSKAIVATTIGAEGIDLAHNRDALLADSPKEFAEQVIRLLDDPELAQRLGRRARTLAEQRYAWPAVVRQLSSFYERLLAK